MEDFPKTVNDFRYLFKCEECDFESFYAYLAESHQCETDHVFKWIPVDKSTDATIKPSDYEGLYS